MDITVHVDGASLDSMVREASEYGQGATIGDLVAAQLVQRVVNDPNSWHPFHKAVTEIRDQVIREAVTPLIEEALTAARQPTNSIGEPTGPETTLASLIMAEAKKLLTKPVEYERQTVVQKIVAEQVRAAFTTVVATEVARARAEVGDQIGTLVAEAVKAGLRQR